MNRKSNSNINWKRREEETKSVVTLCECRKRKQCRCRVGTRRRRKRKERLRIKSKLDHNEHTETFSWWWKFSAHWMLRFKLPLGVRYLLPSGSDQIRNETCVHTFYRIQIHRRMHFAFCARKSIGYWITLQYFVCDEWQKLNQCARVAVRNSFRLIDN